MLICIFRPLAVLSLGSSFHTTSRLFNSEPVFLVNGVRQTRSEVRSVHPAERTVAQWAILVDWDLQRIRNYVIVDPLDPSGLLYLNSAEYLAQSKVCASNNLAMLVVARPGTERPSPITSTDSNSSSQNSPPRMNPWEVIIESKKSHWSRASRLSWLSFLEMRKQIRNISARINKQSQAGKPDHKLLNSRMVSVTSDSVATALYMWVRQLAHYAEVKNPGTFVQYFIPLAKTLERITKNNGQMATVMYLKLSLFALYSYISGNPLKTTTNLGLGIRLRHGLPASWSIELRNAVREGSMPHIRLLASLCNMYKALQAPHPDFDVKSIQAPHPELEGPIFEEYKEFCKDIFPSLLRELGCSTEFKYKSAKGLMIRSAGANVSGPAISGITLDAKAWSKAPENLVKTWFNLHGDKDILNLLAHIEREDHWAGNARPSPGPGLPRAPKAANMATLWGATRIPIPLTPITYLPKTSAEEVTEEVKKELLCGPIDNQNWLFPVDASSGELIPEPILGRLHAIPEPAGKVRVVAIVDYWTQVALKPVHDHLFGILKRIPNDGTFDQEGTVLAYFQKGLSPHWSFDLKAATDTIPLALYKECLAPLLRKKEETYEQGVNRAQLWARILTERDFMLPDKSGTVRYGTGQPMGALSSWASMAIVHHSLVQFAHWRATRSRKWFQNYLVLGDDIDISQSVSVSDGYKEVCSAFHIIIGILKSLRSSKNVFEFANQRFCPNGNISPISLKEEISSTISWATRLEYAKRILTRFSSKSKDLAISLIRKASTVAQWAVLSGELSHLRPSVLLQLTRFCLLNPFGSRDPRNFGIDLVLNWLALALPEGDAEVLRRVSKSPDQLRQLQPLLVKTLLTALKQRIQDLIDSVPGDFSVEIEGYQNWLDYLQTKAYHDLPKASARQLEHSFNVSPRLMSLIRDLGGILPLCHQGEKDKFRIDTARTKYYDLLKGRITPDTSLKYTAHSVCSALYLLVCVQDMNLKIKKESRELLTRVGNALRNLEADIAVDGQPALVKALGENYLTPFQNAIALWIEASNLPDPVKPVVGGNISNWLGQPSDEVTSARDPVSLTTQGLRPRIEDVEERLRAPLGVLKLVLTDTLGTPIPDLPYLSYRKPGGWTKVVNHWLSNYWRKEQTLDTNWFLDAVPIGGHGGIGLTSAGYADGGGVELEAQEAVLPLPPIASTATE